MITMGRDLHSLDRTHVRPLGSPPAPFIFIIPSCPGPCSCMFSSANGARTFHAAASLCLAPICVIVGQQIKHVTVLLWGQLQLNESVSVTWTTVQMGFSIVFMWKRTFNPNLTLSTVLLHHYIMYRSISGDSIREVLSSWPNEITLYCCC